MLGERSQPNSSISSSSSILMNSLQSHLTILERAASQFSSRPAFKLARKAPSSDRVEAWDTISYKTFLSDVELSARCWSRILASDGLAPGAIVGLWLGGMDYSDVVTIYGISRAGYVPQLFSLRLPNPTIVFELLQKGKAKALVYDPSFKASVRDAPVPAHRMMSVSELGEREESELPAFPAPKSKDSLLFIFHTSGSTSGSPKLVPCSAGWIDSLISKARQSSMPVNPLKQDISTWMGSMCHIGQTTMLMGSIQHGSCTIQPTKISFSSEELADMIKRCGLNRLHQFATFLSTHIRHARQNPKLLALLQSLDTVLYSGLPLPREDEEFAYSNRLNLVNLFGSTELSVMMLSQRVKDQTARFLRPLEGVKYGFFSSSPTPKTEAGHISANNQLLELVILSSSPDCPHPSLRKADGHYHTGDLFHEVQPGRYLFVGRDDDWIKSLNSLRCDTRAIEENVRATCADLVDECIVVGTGRPSPALFIEPAVDMDEDKIKMEIIRRTRAFHSRRYMHERITDPELVIIVGPKSLPRTATKGNIRRKAVEEQYKDLLDEIFGDE